MTKAIDVALWLHDKQCASMAAGWCDGDGRKDHARRTQRDRAKHYMAATSRDELAKLLHEQMCPAWGERAHGAYYIARSDNWCGPKGRDHIDRLIDGPTVAELAKLIGIEGERQSHE